MLVVVLLLVLVAGGVLVGSVTANHPEWAWLAVLLCAVGAALLVVERVRRRRGASSATAESSAPGDGQSGQGDLGQDPAGRSTGVSDRAVTESPGRHSTEQVVRSPAAPGETPGEETTDAADSIVVSELDAEVVVVDEFPRYHLAECTWLTDRQVIPLPIREALEFGFTPCARCTPDARLVAGQHAAG